MSEYDIERNGSGLNAKHKHRFKSIDSIFYKLVATLRIQ